MDTNEKLMKLVDDTFTDGEVHSVALYIISSLAVGEATHAGIMGGKKYVEGLPPQAVETMYRFDSGLVDNDFYLKNYAVIKSMSVLDKIKLSAITELFRVGENKEEKRAYVAARGLMFSKLDSLILLAFIWKGYEFAINFACKLRMTIELPELLEQYFEERI